MSRFSCIHCCYETNSSSSWKKHTTTKKHIKNIGVVSIETPNTTRELHEIMENPERCKFNLVLNELKSFNEYQHIQLFWEYMKRIEGDKFHSRIEEILKELNLPEKILQYFYKIIDGI
jgi:hypothetical protein